MQYVEFDDRGSRYTDLLAIKLKLTQDFLTESGEIPFSSFGSKVDPFLLNNQQAWQIQTVLQKYGLVSDFVLQGGRLTLVEANLSVDLTGGLNQQAQ